MKQRKLLRKCTQENTPVFTQAVARFTPRVPILRLTAEYTQESDRSSVHTQDVIGRSEDLMSCPDT